MSTFADNLKFLRKRRELTQKQLAESMGIGQTAIANYEQGNRSPDTQGLLKLSDILSVSVDELLGKEAGRDLRVHGNNISLSDLGAAAAASSGAFFERDPSLRGDNPPLEMYNSPKHIDWKHEIDRYIEFTLAGTPVISINRINELALLGAAVSDIYRDVLEPVLYKSGELWAMGKIAIHQEHNISQSITSCMGLLRSYMKRKPSTGKKFIGVVVNGEMHGIGLMMVSDYMFMEGWDVMYLGTYLPGPEAADAIKTYNPDVVGLSVTMNYNVHAAEMLISILKEKQSTASPLILVGGQAFNSEPGLWQRIKADAFAKRGVEAVSMLDKLIK